MVSNVFKNSHLLQKKTTDVVENLTSKLQNISVEDIDEDDKENPLLCSEYINDIYAYMKIMEIEYRVSSVRSKYLIYIMLDRTWK